MQEKKKKLVAYKTNFRYPSSKHFRSLDLTANFNLIPQFMMKKYSFSLIYFCKSTGGKMGKGIKNVKRSYSYKMIHFALLWSSCQIFKNNKSANKLFWPKSLVASWNVPVAVNFSGCSRCKQHRIMQVFFANRNFQSLEPKKVFLFFL